MVKTLDLILDLLIYQISGIEFCADTKKIVAILRPDELSYTFGAEQKDSKTLIRDNQEYLVLDLNKTFNLQSDRFTTDTRAILMEMDDNGLMFLVDRVLEIISIDPDSEITSTYYQETEGREFVERILLYQDRKFILPDYHKIFWFTRTS